MDTSSTQRANRIPAPGFPGIAGWQLPILRYQSVPHHSPETADPRSIPIARLEEQLAFLRSSGFELTGITEGLRLLSGGAPRRIVALTFDDALLDFLNALDLLRKFKASATLYVPTAAVGVRVSRWDRGLSRLGWCQIAEIGADGVEIGSQAVSGRPLDACADAALLAEVRGSKLELEDQLGTSVTSFSYPAGLVGPRVRRAVVAAGYSNACALTPRAARPHDDVFELPRLRVRPAATGDRIADLVRTGGGGAITSVERITMPAWRVARRTALQVTRVCAGAR